jgi:hypothetical protein
VTLPSGVRASEEQSSDVAAEAGGFTAVRQGLSSATTPGAGAQYSDPSGVAAFIVAISSGLLNHRGCDPSGIGTFSLKSRGIAELNRLANRCHPFGVEAGRELFK